MSELMLETDARESMLILKIDGDWSARDFATMFEFCYSYYLWFFVDSTEFIDRVGYYPPVPKVASVNYGSPGALNIIGVGECMKQFKELIMYFFDRDLIRKQKELEIALGIAKLEREEREHIIKLLKFAKGHKSKFSDKIIEDYLANGGRSIEKFAALIWDEKVTGVELKQLK